MQLTSCVHLFNFNFISPAGIVRTVRPSDTVYTKLAAMYLNGTSLQTLVDHLLYVQKIEAGMIKLRTKVDIVVLAKQITDFFHELAETEGINFTVESLNEPLAMDRRGKISSAIRNLLSNAFKYTSPNGR